MSQALSWWFVVQIVGLVVFPLTYGVFHRLPDRRWRSGLLVELLFTLVFAVGGYLRSYLPEIAGTEKPMDFAFMNAISRAEHFPPADPWLSGHTISYYYFGHLMTVTLGKLSG